jgi:hypothetical protein
LASEAGYLRKEGAPYWKMLTGMRLQGPISFSAKIKKLDLNQDYKKQILRKKSILPLKKNKNRLMGGHDLLTTFPPPNHLRFLILGIYVGKGSPNLHKKKSGSQNGFEGRIGPFSLECQSVHFDFRRTK